MKLQIVPARTGVQWVKLGIQTFWRRPLALTALSVLATVSMSLVSILPVLGPALALALVPSALLAMMVATAQAAQGQFPMPALLLTAFRSGRMRAMATLGALYAAAFLLIMGLSTLVDGGGFASAYLGITPMSHEIAQDPDFQSAARFTLALHPPLLLLFSHASGLIHWHAIPPVKAVFFSAVAFLRNWRAYVFFASAWVGILLVCAIVLVLVMGIFVSLIGQAAGILMVGAAIVLTAMLCSSVVFTFRDSFSAPNAAEEAASR